MDTPRSRLHRFLAWLRLEDERGNLSLTTVAFIVGCVCLLRGVHIDLAQLATFALALGAYQAKRALQHRETMKAMAGAHEAAMRKIDQAQAPALDELRGQVAELAGKVKDVRDRVSQEEARAVLKRRE